MKSQNMLARETRFPLLGANNEFALFPQSYPLLLSTTTFLVEVILSWLCDIAFIPN